VVTLCSRAWGRSDLLRLLGETRRIAGAPEIQSIQKEIQSLEEK